METLAGMIHNLKVEVLDPVLCKGFLPRLISRFLVAWRGDLWSDFISQEFLYNLRPCFEHLFWDKLCHDFDLRPYFSMIKFFYQN